MLEQSLGHADGRTCSIGPARIMLDVRRRTNSRPKGQEPIARRSPNAGTVEPVTRRSHLGYAYVTSQMGTVLTGDPRDVALRRALYSVLSKRPAKAPEMVGSD